MQNLEPVPETGVDSDPDELLAQAGSEAAAALTSALERVNTLAHTGRIDRAGLRLLREELERARRVGMLGQQISRIGSDRVRIHDERIDLAGLLRDHLGQRHRELEARQLLVEQHLEATTVISDVTLVFAMVSSLLDWCVERTKGTLAISLGAPAAPEVARLCCEIEVPPEEIGDAVVSRTMSWRLVEACVRKLGLALVRQVDGTRVMVHLDFPSVLPTSEAMDTVVDPFPEGNLAAVRQLAGAHILVVCARRELRVEIREAVHSQGPMLDFVASVAEAREFCAGALPDAIVFEAAQGGAAMQRLMAELRTESPRLPFVEVVESGAMRPTLREGCHEVSRVARPSLREALPAALNFELARAN